MASNPFKEVGIHQVNLVDESKAVSPKVIGATLGGALATIVWTLLTRFVPEVKTHLEGADITALTGATGTLFAAILGYLITDPVRTATQK